jgi:hypothetical protein
MIDMVADECPFGLCDRLLDSVQLLRELHAVPPCLDHRDGAAQMTFGAPEPLDDLRMALGAGDHRMQISYPPSSPLGPEATGPVAIRSPGSSTNASLDRDLVQLELIHSLARLLPERDAGERGLRRAPASISSSRRWRSAGRGQAI